MCILNRYNDKMCIQNRLSDNIFFPKGDLPSFHILTVETVLKISDIWKSERNLYRFPVSLKAQL